MSTTLPVDSPSSILHRRLYAWGAGGYEYRGIRIATVLLSEKQEELARTRVRAAIDLLSDVAPRQLQQVSSLVHSIAITRLYEAIGMWRPDLGAIIIDREFALASDTTIARLASVLIHELTHARLRRAGFSYAESTRFRSEQVCFRAERNFIARLPASEERTRLEDLNARYLAMEPKYWSDSAIASRHAAWRAGLPLWRRVLVTTADFLRRGHRAALSNER